MAAQRKRSNEEKQRQQPQTPLRPGLWWFIFATALLLWDLTLFWPRSHPEVQHPILHVSGPGVFDNVVSMHIVGAAISSAFAKPILWPEPMPTTASKPGTALIPMITPKPERSMSSSAGPQQDSAPSRRFAVFQTTFLATVGDPGLMPLFQSHQVVVEVSPGRDPVAKHVVFVDG